MNLILTEPEGHMYKETKLFGNTRMEKVLSEFLWYKGIYIGPDATLEWNDVHKMYELCLYEHLGNGPNARMNHFNEVENWLKSEGYRYTRNNAWYKWIYPISRECGKGVEVKGCRFFIYPKEVK